MTALLIDSGIDSFRDLAGLLPAALRERVEPDMLGAQSAAVLRVLATIRDERWAQFAHPTRAQDGEVWVAIDWDGLLAWARGESSSSVFLRVEAAASMAGWPGAHVDLLLCVRALDEGNFTALLDALRIAREGLAS